MDRLKMLNEIYEAHKRLEMPGGLHAYDNLAEMYRFSKRQFESLESRIKELEGVLFKRGHDSWCKSTYQPPEDCDCDQQLLTPPPTGE